jgi:hypothetical protein
MWWEIIIVWRTENCSLIILISYTRPIYHICNPSKINLSEFYPILLYLWILMTPETWLRGKFKWIQKCNDSLIDSWVTEQSLLNCIRWWDVERTWPIIVCLKNISVFKLYALPPPNFYTAEDILCQEHLSFWKLFVLFFITYKNKKWQKSNKDLYGAELFQ